MTNGFYCGKIELRIKKAGENMNNVIFEIETDSGKYLIEKTYCKGCWFEDTLWYVGDLYEFRWINKQNQEFLIEYEFETQFHPQKSVEKFLKYINRKGEN